MTSVLVGVGEDGGTGGGVIIMVVGVVVVGERNADTEMVGGSGVRVAEEKKTEVVWGAALLVGGVSLAWWLW